MSNELKTSLSIWNTVHFGFWKDKPLEWYVVRNQSESFLLHLAYGIHTMPFDRDGHRVEWETSAPRRFLYEVFLPKAFTEYEAQQIVSRNVIMEKNVRESNSIHYTIEERILQAIPTPTVHGFNLYISVH